MKTVLHIATILPFDKMRSNKIILDQAKRMNSVYAVKFFRPVPYSNSFLGLLNKKWKMYAQLPDEVEEEGYRIHALKGVNFPFRRCKLLSSFTYVLVNLSKLANRVEKIDFIHARYIFPDGFIAYYINKRYGIPYVLTLRDESSFLRKSLLLKYVAKKICIGAKKHICISAYAREKMKVFVKEPIEIIPHWIDAEILVDSLDPVVNYERIRIVSVGELIKLKHFDHVIKALSFLNEKGYGNRYDFRIVGDGEEKTRLEKIAITQGVKVDFLGELSFEQVLEEMGKSDIFVLASFPESFGRVFIEAMAKGNAVIGVKGTGVYGLFKNSSEMLFTDGTAEDLAIKLKFLLDNPGEIMKMKKKAYEAVSTRFTWDVILPKYQKIYDSI